ncbi:hypothetical protein GQ44DRAFT_755189 [Phaeosphaeriaceae sp. PMI808]|nr:hypothetical protein GQ44DRAFT_755189 [Phaeosphaeriaceae sp. PMI808]
MSSSYVSDQPSGFTNHIKNIAIVGASGTIGSQIVSALLAKKQFNITALSRANSKCTFPGDVKIARIDYANPDTITKALKGQDALIITLSVFAPKDTQSKLLHAATTAGIPWVLPNEFGVYNTEAAYVETIGPSKTQDRELAASLGLSWLGVTCGFWYEYSLSGGYYGINIAKREVTFFDDGNQKLNTSTWALVGRGVAAILSLPILPDDERDGKPTLSGYRNKMVYISSFAVSQRDMFESLKRVTGTEDGDWRIESVSARERLAEAKEQWKTGNREAFGRFLYTRYFIDGEGLFEKTHGLDNERLGLEEEELDKATDAAIKLDESGWWASIMSR